MTAPESVRPATVGETIKQRREAAGLDVAQLARDAGVSRTTIHDLEENRTTPHTSSLAKIRRALDDAETPAEVGRLGLPTTLEQVVDRFEGLRPSVRTWNLVHREGYAKVDHFLDITEDIVKTWRNHNPQTWLEIEVMQQAFIKMLAVKRITPWKSPAEAQTLYAIRLVQWETWWQAHDTICPRWWDCHIHRNPYEER